MLDRKSLISTLWITASLVLLSSLLVAPIRASGFVAASSHPDCLRRDYAAPPGQAIHLTAAPVGKNAGQVSALDTDEDEKDDEQEPHWLLANVRLRLAPPRSFSGVAHYACVAPHLTRASFPLRC